MTHRFFFYFISFIEGAAVMATEIIGAKLLAPLFGSSLYVWSSVMAMTLGGLAAGYFFGGRLSQSANKENKLFTVILLAGLFMMAMPLFVHLVAALAFKIPLLAGVTICSFFILVPPVFCMGMVSPMIVQILSRDGGDSGRRAGEVYAVSTVGGILATFFTGFYLIPVLGLRIPLVMFGGLLVIVGVYYFVALRQFTMMIAILFISGAVILNLLGKSDKKGVLFESEGLLGKLEVVESKEKITGTQRLLLNNNIIQTCIETASDSSCLEYVKSIADNCDGAIQKNALLLGLGGGAVAKELDKKKISVTAIELDVRIIDAARKYFSLPATVTVINDDARHAIERINKKFDIIVVDLFSGEVTPSHVLSKESIHRLKELLTENGKIYFNTYGYIKLPDGKGNISLLKTLNTCGLKCRIAITGKKEYEDYRNLLVIAAKKDPGTVENEYTAKINLSSGSLITDDNPVLEYENAAAAKRWRYYYLRNFIRTKEEIF